MKRLFGWLLLLAACNYTTGPSSTLGVYVLASINGKPLPATPTEFPPGWVVQSGRLAFDPDRRPHEEPGLVRYTLGIQRAELPPEFSTVGLRYSIAGRTLEIDLCPPGALCLVADILTGPRDGSTLTLSHVQGGAARSVFQCYRQLPD